MAEITLAQQAFDAAVDQIELAANEVLLHASKLRQIRVDDGRRPPWGTVNGAQRVANELALFCDRLIAPIPSAPTPAPTTRDTTAE